MLQFLQTGKVLYVLAAVCGLGAISKLVTGSLYKRMIKETGNMALTRNKNLRSLKQKTENMLMLSHGIQNTNAYIEKQLYSFRFMNLSLDNWDNFAMQAMISCFLIGGLAAFGAYWYRCDSYYIVLYGTMGVLTGLFLVLVDNSVNTNMKRQQLVDSLIDYVDNTPHFFRSVDKSAQETKTRGAQTLRRNLKVVDETAVSGNPEDDGAVDVENEKKRFSLFTRASKKEANLSRRVRFAKQEVNESQGDWTEMQSPEDELRKSIDGLKQSLEQIAASREQTRKGVEKKTSAETEAVERVKKELNPEDIKLIGELIQEYLS